MIIFNKSSLNDVELENLKTSEYDVHGDVSIHLKYFFNKSSFRSLKNIIRDNRLKLGNNREFFYKINFDNEHQIYLSKIASIMMFNEIKSTLLKDNASQVVIDYISSKVDLLNNID